MVSSANALRDIHFRFPNGWLPSSQNSPEVGDQTACHCSDQLLTVRRGRAKAACRSYSGSLMPFASAIKLHKWPTHRLALPGPARRIAMFRPSMLLQIRGNHCYLGWLSFAIAVERPNPCLRLQTRASSPSGHREAIPPEPRCTCSGHELVFNDPRLGHSTGVPSTSTSRHYELLAWVLRRSTQDFTAHIQIDRPVVLMAIFARSQDCLFYAQSPSNMTWTCSG